MNYKDVLTRGAWTFVQAFAAVLVITPPETWSRNVLWTATLAGIAAILSLAKTLAVQQLAARKK